MSRRRYLLRRPVLKISLQSVQQLFLSLYRCQDTALWTHSRLEDNATHFYYQNKIKSNISILVSWLCPLSCRICLHFALSLCKILSYFTLSCMNIFACDHYENFPQVNGITWRWKFSNLSAFNSTVALVRRSGGREPGRFSSSWIL